MTQRWVYFIKPEGMDGPIKIGLSDHPPARLYSLTVWSPFPLEIIAAIPGDYLLEANLHDCFADIHLHHEWFEATPRLTKAVADIAAGVPVSEAVDLNDKRGDMRAAHYARRSELRRQRKAVA